MGVIGTPGYMSPEQGEGRWEVVGPPSDVFSLGATLYAILTGGPPFTGKDLFEVLKKTESGEFPAPRQVCPDVPPALDAICRKALAPKIEDRYQSALQLADDLDHWLADEPVSAFREPWFVRAQRWGRRHKTSVAALSALVTAAVVALGVIAFVSDRQKREIERQKARVVQEYQRAEGNFQNARDVVDRLLTRVGEVELADVPQMERARKTLLDDALEFTLRFQKENAGNPAAVLETARAYGRLGEIREMLGDYSHAEEAYKASLRLLENQPEKSAEVRRARARSAMGLAVLLKKSSRWDESERAFARAIALREALAPASPEDRHALDDSRYQLGTLYARMPGKRPEAEQAYRDALARPTKSEAPGSEAPTARAAGRARALNNLGMLQAGTGRRAEAEETFREAIGLLEPLKKREPDVVGHRWLLARVYGNLGTLLKDNEARRPEAEELKTKARDLQKTLNDQFPAIPDYAYELAATYANLGLLWATSRPKEAEHAYEAARELIAGLADRFRNRPDYRQRLAITLLNLGLLIEKTDPAEAEHTYEEARAIQEALVKEFPTVPEYRNALGRTLYSRANVLKDAGKLDAARRLFKLAIDAQREALKDNRDSVLYRDSLRDSLGSLAETELERGDHDRAADLAEELPRTVPEGPLECVRAAGILSRCANLAGADRERAEEYARKAVGLLRQALAKGLRDINELDRRSQFDPIRERSDFQEIRKRLADLAKAPLS